MTNKEELESVRKVTEEVEEIYKLLSMAERRLGSLTGILRESYEELKEEKNV